MSNVFLVLPKWALRGIEPILNHPVYLKLRCEKLHFKITKYFVDYFNIQACYLDQIRDGGKEKAHLSPFDVYFGGVIWL